MGMYPGGKIIRVTPTLSTDAYAAGDVFFTATEIPNAVSNRGGVSMLVAMYAVDTSDNADDILFVFSEKGTNNLGTINASAGISDDNLLANDILGTTFLDSSDADSAANIDNSKIHQVLGASGSNENPNHNMLLKAADGSTSVYIQAILTSSTTPTFAADDFQLIFHIKHL